MIYERVQFKVEAQQWKGKVDDITVADIRIVEGVTGYNGRLAYYDDPQGKAHTIRPNEFIVKFPDGRVKIMSVPDFEKDYKPKKVANGSKSTNNKSTTGDNKLTFAS